MDWLYLLFDKKIDRVGDWSPTVFQRGIKWLTTKTIKIQTKTKTKNEVIV
jgi:hypothetical protein